MSLQPHLIWIALFAVASGLGAIPINTSASIPGIPTTMELSQIEELRNAGPYYLEIAGTRWAVRRGKLKKLWGETDCSTRTITIDKRVPQETCADTLTHEILHAIDCTTEAQSDTDLYEELFIEQVDSALTEYIRFTGGNPQCPWYAR